jgi:hypothetical protein
MCWAPGEERKGWLIGWWWYVLVLALNKIGLDLALAEPGSIKMWKGCISNMYDLAKINNVHTRVFLLRGK